MGKVRVIEQGYSTEERSKEIDKTTKDTIRNNYELEDEIKLLRRAIVTLANALDVKLPSEFMKYNTLVETLVSNGKKNKAKLKPQTIKIRDRKEK